MTRDELPVTPDDVRRAAAAIEGQVLRTPSAVSRTLSAICGTEVVVKFENLQFTASYKERGALNRLLSLTADERDRGVVAMSAGNHAQGLAYHARRLGVRAVIVMPADTPAGKVQRTTTLGAEVVLEGSTLDEAATAAHARADSDGLIFVPPYDDPHIIAGQGTVAIELLEDHPDLDVIVTPVGGGGLIAGVATVAKDIKPGIEIVGVQSELFASMVATRDASIAVPGGPTIAEGIAVTTPGVLTSRIVDALVDDLLIVSEQRLEEAVVLYLEIEKVVAEGAGAAGLAALLEHPFRFRDKRVGLVLTGGNIDLRVLSTVIMRGLARSGRLARIRAEVPDLPGALAKLTTVVGEAGGNIVELQHDRSVTGLTARIAEVDLLVETRDRHHALGIVSALLDHGYTAGWADREA